MPGACSTSRYLLTKRVPLWAEAEPLYERAFAIREKALGPDHPDTATPLNNLAGLYQDTGRLAEAEPLYRRAVAILEKLLPIVHPNLAAARPNLATLRAERDRACACRVCPSRGSSAAIVGRPRGAGTSRRLRDSGPAAPRVRRPLSAPTGSVIVEYIPCKV